jgi:hypothetical protein
MDQKLHAPVVKHFLKKLIAICLACGLGLFAVAAWAPPYWDPPVVLTPANPWAANLTRHPTLIYADPQGQTLTLDWAAHGNTWLWDGAQWHYRGHMGSLSISSLTIIGMVPTSYIMYYDATLAPPAACMPATCQSLGRNCGSVADGCGGTLPCGTCSGGLSCGGSGVPGVCGSPVASCVSGNWSLETVDSAGDVGRRSDIAVEPNGKIHIVYYDVDNHRLKHASRNPGGAWSLETVDQAVNFEDYAQTALALDNAGGLHLAYQRRPITGGEDLIYAYRSPTTGWTTPETVEPGGRTGFGNDLLVDGNGGLHLSYHRHNPDQIRYRYRPPGGNWRMPEVVGHGYGDTALARGPGGGLHFSFSNGSNLFYRFREAGGNWHAAETILNTSQLSNRDLALDSQGGVHVAFQAGGGLNHAYRTPGQPPLGGQWSQQNLDYSGSLGPYLAMALDPADRVHIAYRDAGNDDLKYIGSTLQGSWNPPTVVDAQGQLANYDIGETFAAGQVFVSYFDWSNGDLKLAVGCP